MAKHASASTETKMAKKAKLDKKNKKGSEQAAAEANGSNPSTVGFSLFSGKKADLDDIFSKGAAFATAPEKEIVAPPANAFEASTSQAQFPEASTSATRKRKSADIASVNSKNKTPVQESSYEESDNIHAEESDDEEELENAIEAGSSGSASEDASEKEEELVHEALRSPQQSKNAGSQKYTPPDETSEDRDRRTVFIGNLPVEVVKSKPAQSHLRAHVLTFTPGAKIESIRYRSIPFANPTTARPLPEGQLSSTSKSADASGSRSQRERERAAAWRGEVDGAEDAEKGKVYLDAKGKRKVAFIKRDFHSSGGSCNAYLVFAHPHPDRPQNLPPILDPYVAAVNALSGNGSNFMDRIIRVDAVSSTRSKASLTDGNNVNKAKKTEEWLGGADPKLSVFVGGLDYETKEDEVRTFFEDLIEKERSESRGYDKGKKKDNGGKWVTGVRLIRDKDTQLGKGFGYVQFVDQTCVDEVIALSSTTGPEYGIPRLKIAKRPVRIQRCKAKPSKPSQTLQGQVPGATGRTDKIVKDRSPKSPAGTKIPRGNPLLGEKIKDLSKEERKAAKADDATRQARRLAKKKAKVEGQMNKERGAVKLGAGREGHAKAGSGSGGHKFKAKKGRVRSAHALTKMKGSRG